MSRRTPIAPRDRHLIDLQAHEGRLIAAVKKAGQLGHRVRYNDLRMQLVKVRERIRRAGGEPVSRPLAGAPVPEREPAQAERPVVRRDERPNRADRREERREDARGDRPDRGDRPGPLRRPADDARDDIPEDEEPPADDEGTEGWDDEDPMDVLVHGIEAEGGTIIQRRGNTVVARARGRINDGGKVIRRAIREHLRVDAAVRQLSPNTVRITLPEARRSEEEDDDFGDEPKKKVNIFDALRKRVAPKAGSPHAHARPEPGSPHKPNVLDKLKDLVHKKGPHTTTRLGKHMAINVRAGFRAAVMEVRPGLFIVAEVPTNAVRADFGEEIGILPLLLAPMIIKAVRKGMEKKAGQKDGQPAQPAQLEAAPAPKQLTGPVATDEHPFGLDIADVPRWLDADLADEFGCDRCARAGGR